MLKEDDLRQPIVQNKAKGIELNFNKQYKKILEYCDRESYEIHEKEKNPDDKNVKGAQNKSCVYMDMNAGLLEASKKNLVRILEQNMNVTLAKKPKVETYGTSKAMERILLDMKMVVENNEYDLKLRVFSRCCSKVI